MVSQGLILHLPLRPHLSSISTNNLKENSSLSPSIPLFPTSLPTPKLSFTHPQPHFSLHRRCSSSSRMDSTKSKPSSEIDEFEPDPSLTNDDLKPTTHTQRIFSGWDMASLCMGLVVSQQAYYLAGNLVDLGMAWWQGIAAVLVTNIILFLIIVITGHPGTRYGISFPVLSRSAFGIHGAHIPALLRALAGCGWYGIETWIGGQGIFLMLPSFMRESRFAHPLPWLDTSPLEFACFSVLWAAQLRIILKGIDGIRVLEKYSAPILIAFSSCLLAWAYFKSGGFGHMLSLSSSLLPSELWSLFFYSLSASIRLCPNFALNMLDFNRYAKNQTDQVLGQAGLPIFMGVLAFVGLAVTSSTEVIFGHVISSPIQLLLRVGGLRTMILGIVGIILSNVTTNVGGNIVAPANAFVNLNPSKITFRRGALLTALLGIAFQPWKLLQSSESFVYKWLMGYHHVLFGPIFGIILADYYLVCRTNLNINELYSMNPRGSYYYSGGYNLAAMAALVIGILPVILGLFHKVRIISSPPDSFEMVLIVIVHDNTWIISFFSAGIIYWILSSLRGKKKNFKPVDPLLTTSILY